MKSSKGNSISTRRVGLPHLILGLFVLLVSGATEAASATKVTVGQSFVNPAAAGFWVGRDLGLFAKYGLDITLVPISGDTRTIQTLLSGDIQFALGSPTGALSAVGAGADLIVIETLGPRMPYLLMARPTIRSAADLKEKRLGVSSAGLSASRVALLIALKQFGLEARRDGISFLVMGTEPERVQALAAGNIDATVLDPLYRARAERLGLVVLSDLSKMEIPWDHDVVLLKRQFAKSQPEVVEALLKGLLEANAFILNPANKKAVLPILAKELKLDKEEDIELAYTLATTLYVVRKPYPSRKAVENLIETFRSEFPALAKVSVDAYIDLSFLRKLDEAGFIDQLYSRK